MRRAGISANRSASFVTFILAWLLLCQPAVNLSSAASASPLNKPARLTPDQRVAHVLSRLTFGARPGDFERVKTMSVEAFINQQLDPESIDTSALSAKLRRLPTLNMATPVIIEQYTPPKPVASPSPVVAKGPENPLAQTPNLSNPPTEAGRMPPAQNAMPNEKQMPGEMQTDARKPATGSVAPANEQTTAGGTPALQSPKPTPPPKNPQMVVTELQRAKLLRAVYSEQQLYEVLVDFWENHFSIFANKDDDRYLLTSFDRETIRPFAMGRFRDLLGATAHSPAMLFYLDNWRSSVPRPYPARETSPPVSTEASMKTTRASCWSCTRSASMVVTRRRMFRR